MGMSFLTPLAFTFAAAIPVVVLFYLLKRKRVVRLVSSTLLWQKFLAETQASAPFQKLPLRKTLEAAFRSSLHPSVAEIG